jgi:DNA-binding MarR family transcriptional regulator
MRTLELPEDYALVLQQIYEEGEQYFSDLAESLSFDRRRLLHIIEALRHKGLILMKTTQADGWLRLTSKGRRLLAYIWPESQLNPSF